MKSNTVHHHVAPLELVATGDAVGAAESSAMQWGALRRPGRRHLFTD